MAAAARVERTLARVTRAPRRLRSEGGKGFTLSRGEEGAGGQGRWK